LIRLIKEALMWRFCIKKRNPTTIQQYSLYIYKKASGTTEIEKPIPKKTDDEGKHKKLSGIYARSICNWISGG
jgi:hypothetical protein